MSLFRTESARCLADGVVYLPAALDVEAQAAVVDRCAALMDGDVPAYVPVVRGGAHMHVRMLCLGRHWNGRSYTYELTRTDFDQLPVPPIPEPFVDLAAGLSAWAGMPLRPDICILNHYGVDGRMGLHQDKDETPGSVAAGTPIVSISLGDAGRFLLGGVRRRDPVDAMLLASGDVLVLGGPARLRYHGISRIYPGTAPAALGMRGRLNLTFRRY